MTDEFRHISARHDVLTKIKGSRFIATAIPSRSPGDSDEHLAAVRKEHHSATHHCYAYIVGVEPNTSSRYSDDGEPSGTAGVPILRQIQRFGVTDTMVIVTRYYGGTKLGTGGLARAYGGAASAVLEGAETSTTVLREVVCVTFEYDDTSLVQRLIEAYRVTLVGSEYGDTATLRVGVPRSTVGDFEAALIDQLGGRVACKRLSIGPESN